MTLIAQKQLVDAPSGTDMLELLDKSKRGAKSWVDIALRGAGRATDALFSKIGIGDDSRYHDCAIVERTAPSGKKVRYIVVGWDRRRATSRTSTVYSSRSTMSSWRGVGRRSRRTPTS